jgi:hypothetical protein
MLTAGPEDALDCEVFNVARAFRSEDFHVFA